ncbi:uncharacterized protein LOC142765461 [Rhipicephalus microplus]|uniref:uncharacterized protein LOC142765461 n=1 Tax=Rhipicephalus microplus TaxID=6941 RepID=UPI003F6C47D4
MPPGHQRPSAKRKKVHQRCEPSQRGMKRWDKHVKLPSASSVVRVRPAMSFSGLAPPQPFLPTPGRPSLPWDEWEQTLTVYLLASGAAEFPPARRKPILLHCLGAEGQRVYRTLPAGSNAAAPGSAAAPEVQEKPPAGATDEYEAALSALRQQFSTSCNVVVEHHRFHRRSQHAGESVHDFVAALRELVSHCSFVSQDDALRDRFVAGVVSNRVRERLLLEGSSLSFESAVRIALQFEQAAEELKEFSASVEPVSVWRRSQYLHSSRKFNFQPKAHFQQNSPSASGSRAPQGPRHPRRDGDSRSISPHCFRCGSRNHRASASQFPAQGKKCLFCGIKGNFQKGSTLECLHTSVAPPPRVNDPTPCHIPMQSIEQPRQANLPPALEHDFGSVFSPELGLAKRFTHRVKIRQGVQPVSLKLRRLPYSLREPVSNELHRLLSLDIIERIDASELVSPTVVVDKKDGTIRICVDLREPNKAIVPDSFPLPHTEELLHALVGATHFSKLDLASAYHQVLLHPDSRDLTAFITHEGLFRFKRVCFGLASAPAAFQKMMATILDGCPGVLFYIDDVIVFGKSAEEHLLNLTKVLQKIKFAGLELNDKWVFDVPELSFLRHKVTAQGISPLPKKVDSVVNTPVPTDVAALRSFLGLVEYYSKFVPRLAQVVEPMRVLLRKNEPFIWGTSPPYQRSELPKSELPVQGPQPALPPPPSPGSQPPPPGVLQSAVPQSPAPDPQLPVPEPAMLQPPSPGPQSRSPGVLQSSTSSLPSPAVQHPHRPSRERRPPVWLKDYQTH